MEPLPALQGPVMPMMTHVATTLCPQCRVAITAGEAFLAVGHPFYMALHQHCYPFFDWTSQRWPHPAPFSFYGLRQ